MHTPAFLTESVAIVVGAAMIAYLSYRLGLVPIVGFLIAGVVIGPHALKLVEDPELVNAAAEIGVILLLFTIGLEFSLEKLARIQRLIFGGGGLQVSLATLATAGVLMAFGVDWHAGLFTGFLVSLSSTAIVLRLLAGLGETASTHGQVSLGLLIFQDLAIIVMVLVVPMLGGGGGSAAEITWVLVKALGLIAIVLLVARRLMPPVLERVARTCSPELFLLTVIAICFGTAWLTSLAGVSLSLGAFLAGLVVSESHFSHHAFGEIMPLQILFSAMFFVSVGMLLDVGFLVRNLPFVLAAVALVLVVKVLTSVASVLALGYELPVAAASALTLAQVGEFSFVLERAGREVGLSPAGLGDTGSQTFIASTVLLMVATPQLASLGSRLAYRLMQRRVQAAANSSASASEESPFGELHDHVIVAGYGEAARQLVRVLQGSRVPFVITTLSPGGANEAEQEGLPVLRGDSTRQHTPLLAGIVRARTIVVADDDPATTLRIVAVARSLAPDARIIVRTRYQADAEALRREGADHVIVDELESIVQLFADVLRKYEIGPDEIEAHEATVRSSEYAALRGASEDGGVIAANASEESQLRASKIDPEQTITLTPHPQGACGHLDGIRAVHPSARGCEDCLRIGDDWVHLRICLTCGHVGCCDSSKNRHATKHYRSTSHPIVRSLEPGENWGWCYADEVVL